MHAARVCRCTLTTANSAAISSGVRSADTAHCGRINCCCCSATAAPTTAPATSSARADRGVFPSSARSIARADRLRSSPGWPQAAASSGGRGGGGEATAAGGAGGAGGAGAGGAEDRAAMRLVRRSIHTKSETVCVHAGVVERGVDRVSTITRIRHGMIHDCGLCMRFEKTCRN